eukprot:TRINITY_DN4085_c0_g1_i1.p1 TRINITY_DN4085_c0_g1~~TRINITY_DN4085_c0_g1_i1.p1  ORF type:complete len:791 (+),score=217.66 TRINITY_DN4085_c0_g1_i1:603-2975(+)
MYQNNNMGRGPPQSQTQPHGPYRQSQGQQLPQQQSQSQPSLQNHQYGVSHHNYPSQLPPPPPPPQHMQGPPPPYGGIATPSVAYNQMRPNNIHHNHHAYGNAPMVQAPPPPPPSQYGAPPQHQQQPQQQHGYPHSGILPPHPQNSQSQPPLPPLPHPQHPPQHQPPPPPLQQQSSAPHPPYYPSSSQFGHYGVPPHPPPSQDRPLSPPPPPPPSSPPPLPTASQPPPPPPPPLPQQDSSIAMSANSHQNKQSSVAPSLPRHGSKDQNVNKWVNSMSAQEKASMHSAKQKPSSMPSKPSQISGSAHNRVETEEERQLRKKREYEMMKKQDERHGRGKDARSAATGTKVPMDSSLHSARRTVASTPRGDARFEKKHQHLAAPEKPDNGLHKGTRFVCKMLFRNELPDPTAQPKLLSINSYKDRFTKYAVTSLEKSYKPKLYVEPDLGIPLDLLDLSVYNPPRMKQPMDPEDEELLRDDEAVTPNKFEGIRRKERPTDQGVAWLVKTQYISPISLDHSTKQQAKQLREHKEGLRSYLDTLNNREKKIQAIEESFRVSKLRPVHQTKPGLEPVEIFPLFPDFERWDDHLVLSSFDGETTAEATYNKLEPSLRDELESRAVMKSFTHVGSDPSKPDKFLGYMVPALEELIDGGIEEDISYTWLREYHWELRAEDAKNPVTFVITFGEDAARYLPLPTKLNLQKRRTRCNEDVENQFPVPQSVTVRNRPLTHREEEFRDAGRARLMEGHANTMRSLSGSKRMASDDNIEDIDRPRHKLSHVEEGDHNLSGDEEMSD